MKLTHSRLVNPWSNQDDMRVLVLGKLGFSTKAITKETGLSGHQITYRLHKFAVRRLDYRNGQSDVAKYILNKTQGYVENNLLKQLKA